MSVSTNSDSKKLALLISGIFLFFFFVMGFTFTFAANPETRTSSNVSEKVVMQIKKAMPKTQIDAVRVAPVKGLYEITAGGNLVYIDEEFSHLMIGEIYDLKTGENLTAGRMADIAPKFDWSLLPLSDAIKIGSGDKKLAIFDDPDCPYCRQFHAQIPKLKESGVEMYIFLTPIKQLHPLAYDKSVTIWCNHNREKALADVMTGEKDLPKVACLNPIDRNLALMRSIKVLGTPTMFTNTGKKIEGNAKVEKIMEAFSE